MTADWIQAFVVAANNIDQLEHQHTDLSESAQQGLLRWILDGGSERTGASGGDGSKVTPRCFCGEPAVVPALTQGYESGGSAADHMWWCSEHRKQLAGIFPPPSSPGRPAQSSYDSRRDRIRSLSHRLSRARHQAPAPEPPRMPSRTPSAPQQPKPGPWS